MLRHMSPREFNLSHEPGLWPPTWPMALTMLRLAMLPVFLYVLLSDVGSLEHTNRRWALLIFALMAITDQLDGYLARKLHQTSRLGAMLDPVADKLLIACSVVVLSFSWGAPPGYRIPTVVVIIIYGKDLLIAFGLLVLHSIVGKVTIAPRGLGKLGTFLQLSLVIATLLAPDLARLSNAAAVGLTRTLWWAVMIVTLASAIDYVLLGWRLLREKSPEHGPGTT
jgi:CDP-diacylglycerol--glycerol-3-phosphate 3-phosphatidyltransferase